MSQNITLDPSICGWVLLPLIVIVLFVGVLRHYASLLLNSSPKPNMMKICNANIANYGQHLIAAGQYLSPSAYKERVELMLNKTLKKEVDAANPLEMMNDPNMMMGMMKNQFTMLVPNIGMMMLVSYFFSGFVVAKFPFPLSHRFRGMMQRGLDIDDLDCSYVTSLSLYFLIMSGSQGLLQLLLGQDVEVNEQAMMQMQGPPGQPVDYSKLFKSIVSELEFNKARHKWAFATSPETLLAEWRSAKKQTARKGRK